MRTPNCSRFASTKSRPWPLTNSSQGTTHEGTRDHIPESDAGAPESVVRSHGRAHLRGRQVPQAMGHALLATVNPVLGIYTLIVAAPVAALSTSSVFMNVSTTAALSVAAGADLAGVPDSERAEALAVLVLLVGGIQLAAGLFRLGFLVRFVSNAVMTGFLNGVAALIVLGQLGHLTGFASGYSNQLARALDLLLHLGEINVPATVIGGLGLGGIASAGDGRTTELRIRISRRGGGS